MKYILAVILLLTVSFSYSQKFADKDYYLIDSLILKDLPKEDRAVIDSCLIVFHDSDQDTLKLNSILTIVYNIEDSIADKYNLFLNLNVLEKLKQQPSQAEKKILKRLCAETYTVLGKKYKNKSQYSLAEEYYIKSILYSDSLQKGFNYQGIASLYKLKGNYQEALINYKKSLVLIKKYGSELDYAINLSNMAGAYTRMGDNINSEESYFKALEILQKLNNHEKVYNCLSNIGFYYKRQGNTEKALKYSLEALAVKSKFLDKKFSTTNTLNTIGSIYHSNGQFSLAIDYYLKALKQIDQVSSPSLSSNILNNIGVLYQQQDEIEKSNEFFEAAFDLLKNTENYMGQAYVLNGIGSNYEKQDSLTKALESFQDNLKLVKKIGFKLGIAGTNNQIGRIQLKLDQKAVALENYETALKINREIKNTNGVMISLNGLGETYIALNNIKKAKVLLIESYSIATELNNISFLETSSLLLSRVAEKQGDWRKAFKMFKESAQLKDSIYNDENKSRILKSQFRYEYEKQAAVDSIQHVEAQKIKNAQIAEGKAKLKSKQAQQYLLISGILFIAILSGVFFIYYRNKQKAALEIAQKDNVIEKQRTIQQKLKMLSAQMNPHFIFNSLNSIQYYITINDLGNSKLFLRKFSGLMRKTLENSEHTYISLSDEMATLKEYIDLERLRMEDQFQYTIEINDDIDLDNFNIPTLLIQPYVENAIWHGIAKKGTEGKIKLTISDDNNRLKFVIDDNGIGRLKNQKTRKNGHKSYAMNITKTRLDLINSMEDDIINIEVIDKIDKGGNPTGTTVELYIPNDL